MCPDVAFEPVPAVLCGEFVYSFEVERAIMKVHLEREQQERRHLSSLCDEVITPEKLPTNSKSNDDSVKKLPRSVINMFEPPVATPFDMLELQTIDEMSELSSVLCGPNESYPHPHSSLGGISAVRWSAKGSTDHMSCATAPPSPVDQSWLTQNDVGTPPVSLVGLDRLLQPPDESAKHLQPEALADWKELSEAEVEFGKKVSSMGFSQVVVCYLTRKLWPNKDTIIDMAISLQEVINTDISVRSVTFLMDNLGTDVATVKCWANCLVRLKDLGYAEDKAREALVLANGKFDVVLNLLKRQC